MRRLSGQRGEANLPALLIAISLTLGVLGATLAVFNNSERINRDSQRRVEAQDRARVAVDRITQQLRNMATPTKYNSTAIDRATGNDVIFLTVNPAGPNTGANATNTERLRYCYDGNGTLWRMEQRWTTQTGPNAPATTACGVGAAGWSFPTAVASGIVNDAGQPIFSFNSFAATSDINRVSVDLWVDLDPKPPKAVRISSGVYLRNQNRRPIVSFTAEPVGAIIVLNGTGSSDPEGEPLFYEWSDNGTVINGAISPVFNYKPLTPCGSHAITLKVTDPENLSTTSIPKPVYLGDC